MAPGLFCSPEEAAMFKKSHVIRFLSILALFPVILLLGAAQVSAQNSGSNFLYMPLVMKNYQSWSTNFANVTDLAAAGIWGTQTQVAIDTTNVNSGGKSIKAYETIGQAGSCLNLAFGIWGLTGQDSVDLCFSQQHLIQTRESGNIGV
jgi:hypothetical protein